MAYQVLARKYRPQRFSEVIGQEHVTRTLKNAIEQQRVAHGYIFSGHRGIGKTTIARILAMALNCHGADGRADRPQPEPCGVCSSCQAISSSSRVNTESLTFEETHSLNYEEIDAATNRGIDEARRIISKITNGRPAGNDRYRIIVLDEAHQITDAAFNSMLKTLEEPPPWAVFMMATTQPEDIPQTVRSRCQHFSFHAVKFDEIVNQLRAIAHKEKIQADDGALAILAEAGDGSMRDALSIMDQAIACCGDKLTAEVVLGLIGSVGSEVFEELIGTVARNSSQEALHLLDKLMTEGQNPTHFARQLVRFLRNALVAKVSGADSPVLQISSDERQRVARVAGQFSEEDLARFLQIMLRTYDELGYRQEQRFHLELGVLKLVHAQRILPLEQILSQVSPEIVKPIATARQPAVASTSASPAAPRVAETRVSPFEADRARKARPHDPEMSAAAAAPQMQAEPVAVGDAKPSTDPGRILGRIIAELEQAGHGSSAMILEKATAQLQDAELVVTADVTAGVLKLAFSPEHLRVASTAASAAAGRPLKVKVVTGSQTNGNGSAAVIQSANGGTSATGRAANDPVVQRMREKFGAEIRAVVDHRQKN
jgi:DNA polymerase III subunit gamma/tau